MKTFPPGLAVLALSCVLAHAEPAAAPPVHKVHVKASMTSKTGKPNAGVILASDGNFYGVTVPVRYGDAKIFRMSPAGEVTVLHQFPSNVVSSAALVQGPDGAIYGTGSNFDTNGGIVFRVTLDGDYSELHTLTHDDGRPANPLIVARDGTLVGVTEGGGSDALNRGRLFRISTQGAFSVIATLTDDQPNTPDCAPLEGDDGNFYLTAQAGGSRRAGGLVQVSPAGDVNVLYEFTGAADGARPVGGLAYDAAHLGMFGMTKDGYVFEFASGSVKTIAHLPGRYPGALALGPDQAHFYVTDDASVYEIAPDGTNQVVATLPGNTPFYGPERLVFNPHGAMIGTTATGGTLNDGTVFKIGGF